MKVLGTNTHSYGVESLIVEMNAREFSILTRGDWFPSSKPIQCGVEVEICDRWHKLQQLETHAQDCQKAAEMLRVTASILDQQVAVIRESVTPSKPEEISKSC